MESRRTFEFEKKFEVIAEDPHTLMSVRERKFQVNKALIKGALESGLTRNHKDSKKNFVLQSNHYRFNRMKEGGWGNPKQLLQKEMEGISTAPHSTNRAFMLPNIGSTSNVMEVGLSSLDHPSNEYANPLDSLNHSAIQHSIS